MYKGSFFFIKVNTKEYMLSRRTHASICVCMDFVWDTIQIYGRYFHFFSLLKDHSKVQFGELHLLQLSYNLPVIICMFVVYIHLFLSKLGTTSNHAQRKSAHHNFSISRRLAL